MLERQLGFIQLFFPWPLQKTGSNFGNLVDLETTGLPFFLLRNGLSIFGLQKEMVLSIAKMDLECLDL